MRINTEYRNIKDRAISPSVSIEDTSGDKHSDKIFSIDALPGIIDEHRKNGKRIIHCHGVFDLLHIGHIRYFKQAKEMGDILVVTVTSDKFVDKGPGRPAFNEDLRAEAIASLKHVDYVAVNKWDTAEETLRLIKPDIYVKGSEFKNTGSDYTGKIAREVEVINEIGASIAFTEDIVFSSSNLINRYMSGFSEETDHYLTLFRKRYSIDQVNEILEKMASLRVLVIGDTILDEYQYCQTIGKSSKDPTLALKYQSHEVFAGGVLAVANHVSNFAGNVKLATVLGEQDSREDFVKANLNRNISPYFLMHPEAPTIIKRRFIDGYSTNKLFEVYVMNDTDLPPEEISRMTGWLREVSGDYDMVIASDFGHGAISREMVRVLTAKSKFLAVNTQANAGNRGFHTITRYPRADYACIAEHELNLETRSQNGNIRSLMDITAAKIGCSQFVVTRGRKGCAICDESGGFIQVPAFARNVVDRVGAGDAFLAVTSMASVLGTDNELLAFIGNVVGSLAVEVLGNKKPIDKLSVQKYIVSLLK